MSVRVYILAERFDDGSDYRALKIGISANPAGRAHALNAGNPREVYVAFASEPFSRAEALEIERAAHEDLGKWALGREWFYCPLEYGLDAMRSNGALVQ